MADNQTAAVNPNLNEEKQPASLKKKLTVAIGTILFVAIAVVAIVVGIHYVQLAEGTIELEETVASLTPCPKNAADTVDYLKRLYSAVDDPTMEKIVISGSISVDNDSVVVSKDGTGEDTDGLRNVLLEAKNSVLDSICRDYYSLSSERDIKKTISKENEAIENGSEYEADPNIGRFGGSLEGLMPSADFTVDNLVSAVCETGCMEFNKDTQQDELVNTDYYYIDMVFKNETYPLAEDDVLYNTFRMQGVSDMIAKLENDVAASVSVVSSEIVCNGFSINARADRSTDEIDYAEYVRNYKVTLVLDFTGDFAAYGRQTVSFDYSVAVKYDFSFAGIRFAETEIVVEHGDEKELVNTLTLEEYDDPNNVVISWSSSDTSIATVTENGYVTGVKASETPITITATVDYLGHTYVQTCKVTVANIVEKILVSPRELELQAGETAQLSYDISPENATIKDVLWFTEDESIATVDENGVVTAVGSGSTVVYVVSVDEHYKSSCTVTVK